MPTTVRKPLASLREGLRKRLMTLRSAKNHRKCRNSCKIPSSSPRDFWGEIWEEDQDSLVTFDQPESASDVSDMKLKEVEEVIKKPRSSSALCPRSIPFKGYMNYLKL